MRLRISKSSRHSKILEKYGELLVANWLSRSGLEVLHVDHVGIDLIAFNPNTNERMGISVKSRTREEERENSPVRVLRLGRGDREKLEKACDSFACEAWLAIYVEATDGADLYLTSLRNYDNKYGRKNTRIRSWKMDEESYEKYKEDPMVKHISFNFRGDHWAFS